MQICLAQGVAVLDNHAQHGCPHKDAHGVAVLDNYAQCACTHKDARGVAVLDSNSQMGNHVQCVCVKSGSTPVGGPVKSRRKRTKDKGRGLDKELVRPELVTAWIQ